jgi:hypothetical protein
MSILHRELIHMNSLKSTTTNNNNTNNTKNMIFIKSTENLKPRQQVLRSNSFKSLANSNMKVASSDVRRSTSVLLNEHNLAAKSQKTQSKKINDHKKKLRSFSSSDSYSYLGKFNKEEHFLKANSSMHVNQNSEDEFECQCFGCMNKSIGKIELLVNNINVPPYLTIEYSKKISEISSLKLYNLMNTDCHVHFNKDNQHLPLILNIHPNHNSHQSSDDAPIFSPQYMYIIDCRLKRDKFLASHINTAIYYEDLLNDTIYLSPSSKKSTLIVLYNENGKSFNKGLIPEIASKLEASENETVYVLNDGFDRFSCLYPFMCSNIQIRSTVDRFKYLTIYPNCIIENCMYLGNAIQAKTWKIVRDLGITHIINCSSEHECLFSDTYIEYLHVKLEDSLDEDLCGKLERAIEFITEALNSNKSSKILVHCNLGISRSASILISYIVFKYKICFEAALNYVKDKRVQVEPNLNFAKQLKKFSREFF